MKLRILFILITIFGTVCSSFLAVYAQGTSPSSTAQAIPLYTDAFPPILVADQNRTVHAFNSETQSDEQVAIFYRQWNIDRGWSLPVDILLTFPSASDALKDVLLDSAGIFHMVYYNGDQFGGDIMYTRAMASDADRSQAWSEPIEIGIASTPLSSADLAQFGDDHLSLVYSGAEAGVALYETHSDDGGQTWTKPIRITPAYADGVWPYHIQTMFDNQGVLHVTWGIVGVSGIGEKVYYTSSESGTTWRNPYLLAAAEGKDYGADWPSIIEYEDQLIVMYMDGTIPEGVPPTRWMRQSYDGGKTWSNPVRPFPQVGENGKAVLLVDSNNTLHIILANRVGEPAIGGLWHGIWIGNQWGELELVTPRSAAAAISSGSYATVVGASRPNAVIVQGNVLLSTWWHDIPGARVVPPAGYSYMSLYSPELPIVPLPQNALAPTSAADPIVVATITSTISPSTTSPPPISLAESGISESSPQSIDATGVIFIGLVPVLILTAIVVGANRLRSLGKRS
jgi:hypothetical protein